MQTRLTLTIEEQPTPKDRNSLASCSLAVSPIRDCPSGTKARWISRWFYEIATKRTKSERNRNFPAYPDLTLGGLPSSIFFLTKDYWTVGGTQNSHFNRCRGLEAVTGRVPVSPLQQTISGTRFQDRPLCEVHRHHLISYPWCWAPGNTLIGTSSDILTFTLQRATLAAPSW